MNELSSSFVDERARPPIDLRLDAVPMRLSGLAGSADERPSDDLILSLMFGSVFLGTIRRNWTRPDTDGAAGEQARETDFDVPDYGLSGFAAITGLRGLAITVETADGDKASFALRKEQPLACGPLGIRHESSLDYRLTDLWLESSRNLTLRFEADAKIAKTVDAYQCANSALVNVAADRPLSRTASLVSITLINPFAPVLFVLKGEDGSIDAIDFLPFPSLVRGGLHGGERLIAGGGAEDVADTATLSAELVGAWLQRLQQPERCVTSIRLDPRLETGLEPILNPDLLSWITAGLGIDVGIDDGSLEAPAFIAEALARYPSSKPTIGHTLHLPADCIPTIAGLLRPLPINVASEVASGGMGIVDWNRHGRTWSVWQPPFTSRFEDLQFAGATQFVPAIAVHSDISTGPEPRRVRLGWPLALAFRDQPMRMVRNSPFEIAPDYIGPLLRKDRPLEPCSVAVLVLYGPGSHDPLPLLESIARQDRIRIAEIAICRPDKEGSAPPDGLLSQQFEGLAKIIKVPVTAGRLEQIVAARDSLSEQTVFVADAATVLPDKRTLSTLSQILEEPDVASVGCLVRSADEKMKALCAGYSFAEIDLRGTPGVSFGGIDPAVWRGPSTYPVVANPLSAVLTRGEVLAELKADGSSAIRSESDDLLFGMQLIERGGINLCTTIVSVFAASGPERLWPATVAIPYRLSPDELARIVERSTVVQRVG